VPEDLTIEQDEPQTFMCPHCEDTYEDEQSAMDCCPPYACSTCGDRHDYEEDAEECCQYRCRECGELYEYESDAENCCMARCEECGEYYDSQDQADTCCRQGGDPYYPTLPDTQPYYISIDALELRPARLLSIEQELTAGGAAVAAMLADYGLSHERHIQYYSSAPSKGWICVCEDGSLPSNGGEVKYSKFDLSQPHDAERMSLAVTKIRQLHKDAGIVDVGSSAGMHIHQSAKDQNGTVLGPYEMCCLHELFSHYEDMIYGLAAAGWQWHRIQRGNNDYAKPIPKMSHKDKTAWKLSRNMRGKYYGINFERLLHVVGSCSCGSVKFGSWSDCECGAFDGATVEWRVFNTSTMPETIHAWALVSSAMMALAHLHKAGELTDHPFHTANASSPSRIRARQDALRRFLRTAPLTDDERDVIRAAAERSPLLKIGG
jgi:hypothetical protein